jgi:hypothetical protein
MSITRSGLLVALTIGLGSAAVASQSGNPTASAQGHVVMPANEVKWGPAPPGLPPGAQAAVLSGDPSKAGPFALTARLPDGYRVPPHSHPTAENVIVTAGTLMVGMGDKADEASMKALGAGGYALMPQKMTHYVRAKGPTTIIVQGMGPFEINYVNPQDDPRKTAK